MQKINIVFVVRGHLGTLRNSTNGKFHWPDLVAFFVLPVAVSISFAIYADPLSARAIESLAIFFGIFVGLLPNIHFSIYAASENKRFHTGEISASRRSVTYVKFSEELNFNVGYASLVAIFGLMLSVLMSIGAVKNMLFESMVLFLFVHLLLTMLMISKRAVAMMMYSPGDRN